MSSVKLYVLAISGKLGTLDSNTQYRKYEDHYGLCFSSVISIGQWIYISTAKRDRTNKGTLSIVQKNACSDLIIRLLGSNPT